MSIRALWKMNEKISRKKYQKISWDVEEARDGGFMTNSQIVKF